MRNLANEIADVLGDAGPNHVLFPEQQKQVKICELRLVHEIVKIFPSYLNFVTMGSPAPAA
jgi:hypothetical protein